MLTYYKENASFPRLPSSLFFFCFSWSKSISFSRVIFLHPILSIILLFICHPRTARLELCSVIGYNKNENKGERKRQVKEEKVKNNSYTVDNRIAMTRIVILWCIIELFWLYYFYYISIILYIHIIWHNYFNLIIEWNMWRNLTLFCWFVTLFLSEKSVSLIFIIFLPIYFPFNKFILGKLQRYWIL